MFLTVPNKLRSTGVKEIVLVTTRDILVDFEYACRSRVATIIGNYWTIVMCLVYGIHFSSSL